MKHSEPIPSPESIRGPIRLVVQAPSVSNAEIVVVLDILDQLVAQLWEQHGDGIVDFMIEERRRKSGRARTRCPRPFPF